MRPVVYIAGPYTGHDTPANVRRAVTVMHDMIRAGLAPVCPHLSHLAVLIGEDPGWDVWLDVDEALIARCDGLYRLKGVSKGADREVDYAGSIELPCWFEARGSTVEDVADWLIREAGS